MSEIPQDVIEDLKGAGFERVYDHSETFLQAMVKFGQLQRQRERKEQAVEVGIVGTMPATNGFTMATFDAVKVPIGTKLFITSPSAQQIRNEAYEKCALLIEKKAHVFSYAQGAYLEPDTKVVSFGRGQQAAIKLETYNRWMEDAEEIRALIEPLSTEQKEGGEEFSNLQHCKWDIEGK